MAVTDQQKIDFLLKKIGFTKTKTGSVVGTGAISGTPKQPFAEAIPSPLIIANDSLWNESASIPATAPTSDTAQVKVYLAGTSGLRMTADPTSSGQRAYIAHTTYNNTSSARLNNWIDTQFGSSYLIKVFRGDPNSGGVQLSAAGSGNNDGWFFDYSAGILNFNDTNVPSGVTDTNIYIVGYRYIGLTGAPTPTGAGNFTFNNLTVTGDIDVDGHTNLDNISIAGVVTATTFVGDGDFFDLDVDGHTNLDNVSIAGVSTFTGKIISNSNIGIGTASPSAPLHISGADSNGAKIKIEDNNNGFTASELTVQNGGRDLRISAPQDIIFTKLGGSELLYLENGNNVGIGTNNPSAKLDVFGNTILRNDLDVDGHTNLDNVSIAGVSTFSSSIGSIVISDEDEPSLTFISTSGSQTANRYRLKVGSGRLNLQVSANNGASYTAAASIGGIGNIFIPDDDKVYFGTNNDAYIVHDNSDLNIVNTTGNIDVTGNVALNNDLDVDGHTNLDNVSVAGISTFSANSNALNVNSNTTNPAINIQYGGITKGSITPESNALEIGVISSENLIMNLNRAGGSDSDFIVKSNSVELFKVNGDGGVVVTGILTATTFSGSLTGNVTGNVSGNAGTATALQTARNIGGVSFDGTSDIDLPGVNIAGNQDTSGTAAGLSGSPSINITNLTAVDGTFSGNVSIGGTLTYEDVTNIDSVGLITARSGIFLPDTQKALFGNTAGSPDLEIYHDGNHSYIHDGGTGNLKVRSNNFRVSNGDESKLYATFTPTAVELYYNNIKRLETTGIGISVNGKTDTQLLDVNGRANIFDMEVSGISTFAGGVDVNADLDVDGHTNLDNVSIAGISTFGNNVHIADDKKILFGASNVLEIFHQTSNGNSIIKETGGGILSLQTNGSQIQLYDTANNTFMAQFVTGGACTFKHGSNIRLQTASAGITVTGNCAISENVTAVDATFSGDLDVDGHTNLDNVSIAGVSTFAGNVDINADLDVSGIGTIGSGASGRAILQYQGTTRLETQSWGSRTIGTIQALGGNIQQYQASANDTGNILLTNQTGNALKIGHTSSNSFITGHVGNISINAPQVSISTNFSVGGVTTFASNVSVGSSIAVGTGVTIESNGQATFTGIVTALSFRGDGSQLSGISVDASALKDSNGNVKIQANESGAVHVGISTFQDIDVDGHTELDNVNITGVTTFTGNINVGIAATVGFGSHVDLPQSARLRFGGKASGVDGLQIYNMNNGSKDYSFVTSNDTFFINTQLGPGITLSNDSLAKYLAFTNTDSFYVKTDILGTNAKILETNTAQVKLNYLGNTKLETSGIGITVTGEADINGDLDVDGHTNLDNVSIAGVTTFASDINVDGLLSSNNSAITVKSPQFLQINNDAQRLRLKGTGVAGAVESMALQLNTHAEGGSTQHALVADKDSSVKIYYSGNKKLETTNTGVVVTGILTTTDLDVDGHTNLDNVSIAGITTFSGIIDVDGHTNLDNVSVAGVTTFTGAAEFDSDARFDSTITAGGGTGNNGQYLKSTGHGVAWESFPTMRTTTTVTASAGQTTFSFTYNVGFLDVFINGTKLTDSEFTATNGSSVVLAVGCFVGDIVELVSYNTVSGGGGGGAGSITVQDEGSSLSTGAETLNFVGTGVVASGTGPTKTITINTGTADTSNVRTNTLEVVGFTTFQNTVLVKGANTRLNIGDANSQLYMSGNVLRVDAYARDIKLTTNAGGGDSKDIILHGGTVGELLRAHGTGDVDITNTLGIGGSITKASGHLDIRASNLSLKNANNSATYASFTDGGAAELNYNNTKRLETLSNGVNVIGSLFVNGSAIGGGGGGSGFFSQTVSGIHTLSNVGIGTADPEFDLDLGSYTSQNVSTASTIRIMGDGASSANTAIRFGAGGNNVDYTLLRIDGQDGTTDGDGNTDLGFALRYMSAGETGTDNRLAFWADNTNKTKYEALSIYNDGRVLVDNGAGGGHGFYGHPPDHFTVRGSSKLDNVRVVGVSTVQHILPETDSTYDIGTNTLRVRNVYADNLYGDGTNITGISGGGGSNVGITTNLSGNFTATPGSPSTIDTFAYSSGDIVVEYTIYIQNGSSSQTQKLLASRLNANIDSTQFAVMFTSSLLVQCDATISGGNILLRATPETGVSGSTVYKVKREVM